MIRPPARRGRGLLVRPAVRVVMPSGVLHTRHWCLLRRRWRRRQALTDAVAWALSAADPLPSPIHLECELTA